MAHTAVSARPAVILAAPPEIVAYTRVSREEQRISGLGLEAQYAAIEEYARRSGARIVAAYREAATGRRDTLRNRPELVRALGHARRSGALLVFARWDRLSRNVSVTAQLLESGIDFVACDNPYANRLTIHILAAMAEYESRLKSERIRAVFAYMKANGHVFPPGKFAPEAQRRGTQAANAAARVRTKAVYADLLPLVVELRERGYTHAEIASQLNGLGHRNQRKHPWSSSNVWMLLRREGYAELASRKRVATNPGIILRSRARLAYAEIIPRVLRMYNAGKTTGTIAAWLNGRGYKTSRWNEWTTPTIVALLRREGVAIRQPTVEEKRAYIRRGARASTRARRERTRAAYAKARPIAERMRDAGKTYEHIAAALNRRELRSSSGKLWDTQKVWAMFHDTT
jgi:DNA invertase Pin-like site-specific DNA recombinase